MTYVDIRKHKIIDIWVGRSHSHTLTLIMSMQYAHFFFRLLFFLAWPDWTLKTRKYFTTKPTILYIITRIEKSDDDHSNFHSARYDAAQCSSIYSYLLWKGHASINIKPWLASTNQTLTLRRNMRLQIVLSCMTISFKRWSWYAWHAASISSFLVSTPPLQIIVNMQIKININNLGPCYFQLCRNLSLHQPPYTFCIRKDH